MTEYPKALYKGGRYTEWSAFCRDLENKVVESCIVTSRSQENERRAEGYTDAAILMTPDTPVQPKKRGMPKGGWPKKEVSGDSH